MRYESLELRAQQAQQALSAAAARAAEADSLSERLEQLQAEHAVLRASSDAASGSQQGELATLRAANAALKDEVTDLRSLSDVLREQLARQPGSAGSSGLNLASGGSGLPGGFELERDASLASLGARQLSQSDAGGAPLSPMDSLMSPVEAAGAQAASQLSALAGKDRELAAARQRAAALEAELADLEQECALRQAQEKVRAPLWSRAPLACCVLAWALLRAACCRQRSCRLVDRFALLSVPS